jgi:transposase InsO family protein
MRFTCMMRPHLRPVRTPVTKNSPVAPGRGAETIRSPPVCRNQPNPSQPLKLGKGGHKYLYGILEISSRYVFGWMLPSQKSAPLAQRLIETNTWKQDILPKQLTVQADLCSTMISISVAFLLADLGITKTHPKPHASRSNPVLKRSSKFSSFQLASFPPASEHLHGKRLKCICLSCSRTRRPPRA